jgi:hypothetical protein
MAIDLANEISWEDDDFYDFEHNTPQGTGKIGRYLHQHLEPLFQDQPHLAAGQPARGGVSASGSSADHALQQSSSRINVR